MTESRDYLEMSFRSIECFANDGRLDTGELGRILEIAEKDGDIDDNERRVLKSIIQKITPSELDDEMKLKVEEVYKKIGF